LLGGAVIAPWALPAKQNAMPGIGYLSFASPESEYPLAASNQGLI
jgi:hypothetical protein